MTGALLFAGIALVLSGVLVGFTLVEARNWNHTLQVYRLRFPSSLAAEQVAAWLAGLPPASQGLFGSVPQFGLEILANTTGIEHRLLLPKYRAEALLVQLQTALPGVRYDLATAEPTSDSQPSSRLLLTRLALRGRQAPLATERAEASVAAVLSSLQPLRKGETIRLRWLVASGPVPPLSPTSTTSGLSLFDDEGRLEGDRLRALRKKQRAPLLQANLILGVAASSIGQRRALTSRVATALTVMDAPGAVVRRSSRPSSSLHSAFAWRPPIAAWGFTLNTEEAAGLLGLPVSSPDVPGLVLGAARQLMVPVGRFTRGALVARSDHPASSGRAIRLGTTERLQHLHVLGPTGTGKSTLLAGLVLQDIEQGRGVIVIDPKRDLVETILARIPMRRIGDVMLLDPTDAARPTGLNVLGGGSSEAARELAAEFTLGIFRALFADSWGPRTDDIIRSGLLTLAATRGPGGEPWTLLELPELLTREDFRAHVLRGAGVPESVRGFWAWFDSVSDAQQATVIGPALNKLRAFTTRTPVRLLVGQSQGIDLRDVFTQRRILLVPLSSGELGRPVAELLGALILARLWATVRGRSAIAPERRHPVMVFVDEFHELLRLPVDLQDLLATARGLGVGLTLAHQHLEQLTPNLRAAILNTARSRIVFQLGYDDAKALAPHLPPLTAEELQHLDAHAVAISAMDGAAVQRPVTGTTDPLRDPESPTRAEDVRQASRESYGRTRQDVEAEIRQRIEGEKANEPPLGRRARRPGGSS